MRINKRQAEFITLVEKCGGLFWCEVNTQKYPDSMIDALISKGLIIEYKNKLTSSTL